MFTLAVESKKKVRCHGMAVTGAYLANLEGCKPSRLLSSCVTLFSQDSSNSVSKIRTSLLNLVDLAGSERQRDTQSLGVRLKVAVPQ